MKQIERIIARSSGSGLAAAFALDRTVCDVLAHSSQVVIFRWLVLPIY
jgi:hypothetical protein